MRDECLNETLLGDAREIIEGWQEDYNWRRGHSALVTGTPMDFLHRKVMDKMAA
ncbi:MAG: integrase core domain-containing protein [Yoonia sp.]|nr:integrase core domain-containing protein [Yoonia sp.]